jgi:hypothetical protein
MGRNVEVNGVTPVVAQDYKLKIRSEGPLLRLAQASTDGLRSFRLIRLQRPGRSNYSCKLLIIARLAQW